MHRTLTDRRATVLSHGAGTVFVVTAPAAPVVRPVPKRRSRRTQATADELLTAAVGAVPGGAARPGQQQMVTAIAECIDSGEHLLVQAGTGTGKSLAYLAPALLV